MEVNLREIQGLSKSINYQNSEWLKTEGFIRSQSSLGEEETKSAPFWDHTINKL